MNRRPWERRLEDLAHILTSCGATYFNPDLFRRNTNQFLQTARTVTFIIQKNKGTVPDFADWYQRNVINAWEQDELMQWAKDARNAIEKEGDLELNSQLRVVLIFSYLEEDDIEIGCGRNELLNAGVKKLIRFSQRQLPTGITDAAAVKIERLWRTSKLDSHELLHALSYVYARLFDACQSLAQHLGGRLSISVPDPSDIGEFRDSVRQVELVKLRDLRTYRLGAKRVREVSEEQLPAPFKDSVLKLKETLVRPTDFETAVAFYSRMAETTFTQWGNHVPMLFLLRSDWSIQDMVSTSFEDQADKYFFWRTIAERIKIQKAHCLVYISEVWIRDLGSHPSVPIRKLPIRGEKLQLAAFDRNGHTTIRSWPIERTGLNGLPRLGSMEVAESDQITFFLVPPMRAMGIEPDLETKRIRRNG